MKTRARTFIAALTAMATMAGLASCAHSQPEPGYPICTENEIVTYEPTDTTKTVITIGRYTIFNSEPLQKALSERIPEASFAFVDAPGTNDVRAYVKEQAERNDLPDLVFSGMRVGSGEYAYDLSAEGFTGRYNLSSLEKLSVDGTLRQLPINGQAFLCCGPVTPGPCEAALFLPLVLEPYRQHQIDKVLAVLGQELDGA